MGCNLSVKDILWQYNNCRSLEFLKGESTVKRFNIVTDSIASHSLLGGVATSLILATLVCNRFHWRLRIITRTTECDPLDYIKFMKFQRIVIPEAGVEYASDCPNIRRKASRLEITNKDIFMATSWWSAKALLDSDYIQHIFYIIQEEESFFYPYGDMHLWCKEIMNDERIDYIVNSKLLYDYMKNSGYSVIIRCHSWFEPSFPEYIYCADEKSFESKNRYRMFFYGRPNNPRNLFYHGLEILDCAIRENIINTEVWDIYMAGGDCPDFVFSNGYHPIRNGRMTWEAYSEFARTVDLAFCLMYTPHPSYPPLDMLSSGAVVLTNTFENKIELTYSKNMIMKKLEKASMLEGMKEAIKLAKDTETRKENYNKNRIMTQWEKSFENTIRYIFEKSEENTVCMI